MKNIIFALTCAAFVISGCSDPNSIGSGLLQNEEIFVDFTDTVRVPAKSSLSDTFTMYRLDKYSIGELNDPLFGKTTNMLFMSVGFNNAAPEFSGITLDSIILKIPYDLDVTYGDTLASHHVEVFQIDENYTDYTRNVIGADSIFATTLVNFDEMNKLGEVTMIPGYKDTLAYFNTDPEVDSLQLEIPQLRIRLDNSFGEQFIDMPDNLVNDETFQNIAKGFVIRATPEDNASSYIGLDFTNPFLRRLIFYFKEGGVNQLYEFELGNFSHCYVEQDYSGSQLGQFLEDQNGDQELLPLQSHVGGIIELDLSGLLPFKDKAINNCLLELSVANIDDYDFDQFPPPENITLSFINDNGTRIAISDAGLLINGGLPTINNLFGGNKTEDDQGNVVYTMNITNHVINLLDGQYGDNTSIFVTNLNRGTTPNRCVFNGNGALEPNPQLKLIITEP